MTTNNNPTQTAQPAALSPKHSPANNPFALGQRYYRLISDGLTEVINANTDHQDNDEDPFGDDEAEDFIESAKDTLWALQRVGALFATVDDAQRHLVLAGLHSEARNDIGRLICHATHKTQPVLDPCDDPYCWVESLTPDERLLHTAHETIARLQDQTTEQRPGVGTVTPRTRASLSDAIHQTMHQVIDGDEPIADTPCDDQDCHLGEQLDWFLREPDLPSTGQPTAPPTAPPTWDPEPNPPAPTTAPVGPPAQARESDDEFGSHLPQYQRGRAWALCILRAARNSNEAVIAGEIAEADRLLGPLGNLNHPEDLRDFIAGAARQTEDDLLRPF